MTGSLVVGSVRGYGRSLATVNQIAFEGARMGQSIDPGEFESLTGAPTVVDMLRLSRGRSGLGSAVAAMVVVVPLVLAAGCTKKAAIVEEPRAIVSDYVTSIQLLGQESTTAVRHEQLPAGSPRGPLISSTPEATVVNGGSLSEPIEANDPFVKVRIAVQGLAGSAAPTAGGDSGPAIGYYEITLKQPAKSVQLVLTVAQILPGTDFVFHYAVVAEGGAQGVPVKQKVKALQVGTGDVQVSVSWDAASDVDLHVVDPNSDEIFYENAQSVSGGKLDLDSNAQCQLDHKNNENITWSKAPPGKYTVRLDHWDSCGTAKTSYVVTVQVAGKPVQVFHGEFTGEGDQGGLGDGVLITTFTVAGHS